MLWKIWRKFWLHLIVPIPTIFWWTKIKLSKEGNTCKIMFLNCFTAYKVFHSLWSPARESQKSPGQPEATAEKPLISRPALGLYHFLIDNIFPSDSHYRFCNWIEYCCLIMLKPHKYFWAGLGKPLKPYVALHFPADLIQERMCMSWSSLSSPFA